MIEVRVYNNKKIAIVLTKILYIIELNNGTASIHLDNNIIIETEESYFSLLEKIKKENNK